MPFLFGRHTGGWGSATSSSTWSSSSSRRSSSAWRRSACSRSTRTRPAPSSGRSRSFAEVCVVRRGLRRLSTAFMMWGGAKRVRPIIDWMEGHGDALEAWRSRRGGAARPDPAGGLAAVSPDRRCRSRSSRRSWPASPPYSAFIIFAGAAVAVAYAAVLHFFSYEQFLRPVVEDIVERAAPGLHRRAAGRAAALEAARRAAADQRDHGVVVSGLSTDGSAQLDDLGLDVVVAVLVAFTISLELTVLVTRSVLQPVDDLLEATAGGQARGPRRARAGDLRRRAGPARRQLQRDDAGALRARGAARGVRRLRRPRRGRAGARGGRADRGPGARGHGDDPRRLGLHGVRPALERARDRRVPERPVRDRRPVRDEARRPREQVPRRRPARGLRRAGAARDHADRAVAAARRDRRGARASASATSCASASASTPGRSWWARWAAAAGSSSR